MSSSYEIVISRPSVASYFYDLDWYSVWSSICARPTILPLKLSICRELRSSTCKNDLGCAQRGYHYTTFHSIRDACRYVGNKFAVFHVFLSRRTAYVLNFIFYWLFERRVRRFILLQAKISSILLITHAKGSVISRSVDGFYHTVAILGERNDCIRSVVCYLLWETWQVLTETYSR